MKVWTRRFNTYLMLTAALVLLCSCQTDRKKKEPVSAVRIHIEVNPDSAGTSQTVSIVRSDPVSVTIDQEPILTEANVIAARVFDAPGGFAIEIRFDETATRILEQYSAANSRRHFAIFGQWGDKLVSGRWLAAPTITHRIGNGVLAFTADVSREEADQLVLGLNNVAKKTNKSSLQ
jgi:preprotein translocase subunit SecD